MTQDPIALTQKLIQFPSVTPIDAGIIDFLCEYLTPFGFSCKKLIFEDVTNLYARFGNDEPNFCFAGHTDIVPPGDNWTYDPFAAIIQNNLLYGRGASDMKSAIAAFITATIEFIKLNNFKGSISFLISGDEEGIANNGTVKVLDYLKAQGENITACIVGEPTCSQYLGDIIKYGRRGSINFNLTVIGKQGHVAYPELADNPIDILLLILTELNNLKLDDGNSYFTPSNLEITDIHVGNPTSNIIPDKAEAKFNIRFNDIYNGKSLEELVNKICQKHSKNFSLQVNCSAESFIGAKESNLIDHLSLAIKDILNVTPMLSTTGGTSDARFIKDICPVIEFGLLNATAHKVDEHVACEDIINLKKIYFSFLEKYFGLTN